MRERRDIHCALSDDIAIAVEIISAMHRIPGSSAYQALVRTASNSRLSVRRTARLVVMAPGPVDQDVIAG